MSEENVALARRIYDAWNRGDFADELLAEDIEYVNPHYAVETGTREGRGTFRGFFDGFTGFSMELERLEPVGADEVLALGEVSTRSRAGGVPMQISQVHIWTFRDGKAIRFRWFNNPQEGIEAAGLGP
jgi:ketosteroid isomerase-like protein